MLIWSEHRQFATRDLDVGSQSGINDQPPNIHQKLRIRRLQGADHIVQQRRRGLTIFRLLPEVTNGALAWLEHARMIRDCLRIAQTSLILRIGLNAFG